MKEITRKEAMELIYAGETVICQMRKNEFRNISTPKEATEVVMLEQRYLTDRLKFFRSENNN